MLRYPYIYYGLFTILFIIGLILSIRYIKKQESKEMDTSISPTTVKHQVIGNPGMIVYLIGFAVLVGILVISVLVY